MPSRNAQLDRQLKFIPNRILKADELIRLQELSQARDKQGIGVLFKEGATLNVKTTVSGSTVSLSAEDPAYPLWVFVNGAFEEFDSVSFNLDPSKTSGDDFIYLNWVIWRVTADGEGGTIQDSSLTDLSSGEKVAEAGQLQLVISTEDTSATPLDVDKQFAKNTDPIVMLRLERGEGGSIAVHYTERLLDAAAATQELLGFVKLSTDTTDVAVADDDPRLSAGIPPRSIKDIHVTQGVTVQPGRQTPWFGVAEADVTGEHGISTHCIYDSGTKTLLSDLIPVMVSLLQLALTRQTTSSDPSPAPAPYTPPPAASVPSSHVGQALGKSDTHPARVDADSGGFTVRRKSSNPGSSNSAAFGLTDQQGTLIAGITHDGDIKTTAASGAVVGTTALNTLTTIATTLADHINAHPSGGSGGVSQQYVDNNDDATLAEAKAYTDQKFASGINFSVNQVYTNIHWNIFTINNLQIAYGGGMVQHNHHVELPEGFFGFIGSAGFGRSYTLSTASQMHCYLTDTLVTCFTQDKDGNRSTSDWANVQGICFRWA